ncbi:uncharacterized protein [Nicotiana tomentosiformis]|uniref:uncharacterized protein n=1 Tax=Nicotiana tomentosiformis TaxID=4098 RepID=UPI00388C3F35
MVKRPRRWNPVKHLKKAKVEVHHPQKLRHPVTLEEFLPSWFCTKISRGGIDISCCHADEGEEKSDDLSLAPSSEKLIESTPQEVNACEENVTFTNDDLLLGDTLHNHPLYLVGYMCDEKVNRILVDGGSSVNILPIHTVKELGIPMNELSESHSDFADAKFYLKNRIVKELKADDGMKSKNDEPTTKRDEVIAGRAKAVTKEVQPNTNKSHRGDIVSYDKKVSPALQYVPKIKKDECESSNLQTNMLKELNLPIKRIEAVKLSSKPLARLFAKAGYNPNEPSKLGKLPSEDAMRQPCEGLRYKQPSPVCISIRRASNNYITLEDESAASNRLSVFDRLGKSTVRTSVFERLGSLKKGNKFQRNYRNTKTAALPKIQKISKDFQSLVPSRMKRQIKVMVSCDEVLKVKPYTVVYTKERDEDEENVGSLYHITAQGEHGVLSLMEDDEKLDYVSPYYHISFNDGDPQEDEDAKDAPRELEEGVKTTVDVLKKVNLGTDEEPRPTYLSALLEVDEEGTYIELLKEFRDVFSWSYKEILGLDPKVVVHHLAMKNGACPVKQAQRRFRPDLVPLIEIEVNKLIKAGFIREVKYPTWVSKLMIDATTGYGTMSFIDGSSGYNQIRMAPKDEELTAFLTPKGIYYYMVMPFILKNAGATYQRAMQNIFDDLLHKNVECYVHDLVVKSRKRGDHLKDLRMVFELLRRYKLRMNPLKCAFGVTSKKFLGFIVRHRGIEINQEKVDEILKMLEPRDIHELKSVQGKLAYLRRFISNIVGRCQPFSRLMKKGVPFKWDQACSNAFKSIKSYLMKPPVLAAPILGKPLILYISAQEKAVKGQALADFLADHPIPDDWELTDELPDEDAMVIEVQPLWKMYFDGATHREGAGAGVVAEYQALILGLEMAVKMKQFYEVKKPELCPYYDYAKNLIGWLGDVTIQHVPRKENKKADALAALASSLTLPEQAQVIVCQKWVVPLLNEAEGEENELKYLVAVFEVEKEECRQPIIDYLCYGILPENPRRRTEICCRAPRFLYYKDTLYIR